LIFELFWETYLTGVLLALALSLCGIVVVLRDQIFLGVAVAQSSTVGIGLALWVAAALALPRESTAFFWILEVGAALAAALAAVAAPLLVEGSRLRLTMESVNGWLFLAGASGSVLLVSNAPFGLTEVKQILSAGLLGSGTTEILLFTTLLMLSIVLALLFRHRITLSILDPDFGRSLGFPVRTIQVLAFLWIGVCLGLALRVGGLVYTFGFLVLPALSARECSRKPLDMLWLSPILCLLSVVPGFLLGTLLDLPLTHSAIFVAALVFLIVFAFMRFGQKTIVSKRLL